MSFTKVKKLSYGLALSILITFISLFTFGCYTPQQQTSQQQSDITSYNIQTELCNVNSFYNLVILTNLNGGDETTFDSNEKIAIANSFNGATKSVKSYYLDQSGGKLSITSVFMFYNSTKTESQFKALTNDEQVLFLKDALESQTIYNDIGGNSIFTGDLDANDDGIIDSLTLYVPLTISSGDVNTAAWPHTVLSNDNSNFGQSKTSAGYKFRDLFYNRVIVNSLTVQTLRAPYGVMCHEMFHNIGNDVGVQDLYHYSDKSDPAFESIYPVGNYDIMASTDYTNPQPINAYYKYKLGWLETLINADNPNNRNPSFKKTDSAAVKFGVKETETEILGVKVKESEFFIAQYWKENTYHAGTAAYSKTAGIIIYRVDTSVKTGNMNKPKDEIYIFRSGSETGFGGDFRAVFDNGQNFKGLTYSNGENAKINVVFGIDGNDIDLKIEKYSLDFKIGGKNVPYDIDIVLNGNEEKTFESAFVFTPDSFGKKIYFDCFGYEFYKDATLTNKMDYDSVLKKYYFIPTKDNMSGYSFTIYVKAIPRDITVYLKDFEGKDLTGFNFSSISYVIKDHFLEEIDVSKLILSSIPIKNSAIDFKNLENGNFIYFILDGYRVEVLEITPEVVNSANVNLAKLCLIKGQVTKSNGDPLANVKVFVNGEYATSTDSSGSFTLENIPQGATISFELKDYKIDDYKVVDSNTNLIIKAKNIPNYSTYVIIAAGVIIVLIIIVVIINSFKKNKNNFTNESYFE